MPTENSINITEQNQQRSLASSSKTSEQAQSKTLQAKLRASGKIPAKEDDMVLDKTLMERRNKSGLVDSIRAQQLVSGKGLDETSGKTLQRTRKSLKILDKVLDDEDKIVNNKQLVDSRNNLIKRLEEAHLGYATLNLATDDDFGEGPFLHRRIYNPRPINKSGVAQLRRLQKASSLNRTSTESRFWIVVLVKKEVVKLESLAKDPKANIPWPRLQWQAISSDHKEMCAVIADGNHRRQCAEDGCHDKVITYKKLKTEMDNLPVNKTQTPDTKVQRETLAMLKKQIQEEGDWHCTFYDYDALKNESSLLLLLSENDVFFNQPDSNLDSLHHLLLNLAGKPDQTVDNMLLVHRQARVATISMIDTVFKDKTSLKAYCKPYLFEAFQSRALWKPKQLLQWQMCASPILSSYIDYMVHILEYLSFFDPTPDFTTALSTPKHIINYITGDQSTMIKPNYSTHIFDLAFFEHLDSAYMLHLKNVLLTFGVGDIKPIISTTKVADIVPDDDLVSVASSDEEKEVELLWESAFQTYLDELQTILEDWLIGRKNNLVQMVEDGEYRDCVFKTLDQIIPKMVAIVKYKVHLHYNSLPMVTSTPPFFTRLWYGDLAKPIADSNDGIKILYSFYDPFIYFLTGKTNIKKDNTQGYIVQKAPELFENWLVYHHVRQAPILSIALTRDEMLQQAAIVQATRKINAIIIANRESRLNQLKEHASAFEDAWETWKSMPSYCNLDEFDTKVKAAEESGKEGPNKALRDGIRAVEIIERWRAAGQGQEANSKDPNMKMHYNLRKNSSKLGTIFRPDRNWLPEDDETAANEESIVQDIIDILNDTAHNWGDFINGRLKQSGTVYARYVMAMRDLRQTTMTEIRKSNIFKLLFEKVEWELDTLDIELKSWDIDGGSGMNVDDDDNKNDSSLPMPHVIAGLSEQEVIQQELVVGLQKLHNLAEKHGTLGGLKSSHIIQGVRSLSMGMTELALWKQSQFSGIDHPQRGDISRMALKKKMAELHFPLPDEDSAASAKEFADAIKVQSLGTISKMVGAKRPSNVEYEAQQKKQKRARKEEDRAIKKLSDRASQRNSNISKQKAKKKNQRSQIEKDRLEALRQKDLDLSDKDDSESGNNSGPPKTPPAVSHHQNQSSLFTGSSSHSSPDKGNANQDVLPDIVMPVISQRVLKGKQKATDDAGSISNRTIADTINKVIKENEVLNRSLSKSSNLSAEGAKKSNRIVPDTEKSNSDSEDAIHFRSPK